ncbi:MAG TPA: hypothetical protein VFD92_27905 [Candidatus Binatia bacterium]|nr:hypothetical protein [Candidatus Binatia bacterium]
MSEPARDAAPGGGDDRSAEARGGGARGGPARIARLALPWILTALILDYFRRHWNLAPILETLEGARWGTYFALMVPYSVAYFLLDTLAVTTAVRRFHVPVRYRDILPVRAVTYVLALVNSNVGQGGLALWIHRREGVPLLELAGTFLFLAFVEIYQLVVYSSVGVALVGSRVPGVGRVYVATYVVLAAWLVYFNGLRALGVSRPAPRLFSTFGRARLADYGAILAIKSVSLVLAIATHWAALRLFGMHVPLVVLLANLPLVFLGSAVPLTVGKLHAAALWGYLLADYAPPESLGAYSLAAHLTFLTMNALIGIAFLPRAGREMWELGRRPTQPTSAAN